MATIEIMCVDQMLVVTEEPIIASGDKNEDEVQFEFDKSWDGYGRVAAFYQKKGELYYSIVDQNGKAVIPYETIKKEGITYIGVIGINGSKVKTTETLKYRIKEGIIENFEYEEPTDNMYMQLMSRYGEILEEMKKHPYISYREGESITPEDPISREIINTIYPVGSIYISVNNINPKKFLVGVWERFGNGRVIAGVNESDTDFDRAEKTGGEKKHKLTEQEMPGHTHKHSFLQENQLIDVSISSGETRKIAEIGLSEANTGTAGGGGEHNNLQPYITCYMWKRTE